MPGGDCTGLCQPCPCLLSLPACLLACPADTYQPYLGKDTAGTDCKSCNHASSGVTSLEGADYCSVPWVDTTCGDGAQGWCFMAARGGSGPAD